MGSAVVGSLRTMPPDVGVVELAHRRRIHERIQGLLRHLTVRVVGLPQLDDHEAFLRVVADAMDKTASGDVLTGKRFEVERTPILHCNCLSAGVV